MDLSQILQEFENVGKGELSTWSMIKYPKAFGNFYKAAKLETFTEDDFFSRDGQRRLGNLIKDWILLLQEKRRNENLAAIKYVIGTSDIPWPQKYVRFGQRFMPKY